MKRFYFILILIFISTATVQAGWQDREMAKIDRKIKRIQKCKCLSKTQEIGKEKVSYYFTPKKIQLVKIVSREVVNGATVFKQFFFDKKTGGLIAVRIGATIYYYQSTGYFAVLSSSSFTPREAEQRAEKILDKAKKYIQELK